MLNSRMNRQCSRHERVVVAKFNEEQNFHVFSREQHLDHGHEIDDASLNTQVDVMSTKRYIENLKDKVLKKTKPKDYDDHFGENLFNLH